MRLLARGTKADIMYLLAKEEFTSRSKGGAPQKPYLHVSPTTKSRFHLLPNEPHRIKILAEQFAKGTG